MWKEREMVGRAVGMRTVSRATRKRLRDSAAKETSVDN
jgi:hypothetical protein